MYKYIASIVFRHVMLTLYINHHTQFDYAMHLLPPGDITGSGVSQKYNWLSELFHYTGPNLKFSPLNGKVLRHKGT